MSNQKIWPTRTPAVPPLDNELQSGLDIFVQMTPELASDTLEDVRRIMKYGAPGAPKPDLTMEGKVRVTEHLVPGPAHDLEMTVLTPSSGTGPWPLIYYTHGGGMVGGSRHLGLDFVLPFVAAGSAVVATIEYRLPPEHPDPAPIDDCYAGLCWVAENSVSMNVDLGRFIIFGSSAGGGLAAGTALRARDEGFPELSHQILVAPMLDDRFITHSSAMLDVRHAWSRSEALFGWTALLGDRRGGKDVSPYASPARAKDLAGLPRTYIDVGSVEGHRDESIDYAQRLSAAGVGVDLHVWGGAFHGFEIFADPAVSKAARATRDAFIERALH